MAGKKGLSREATANAAPQRCPNAALAAAFVLAAAAGAAVACPYVIRDSGHIVQESRPFRVYLFVDGQTPERASISGWLDKVSSELANTNVKTELVDVDRGDASYWKRVGSPKPPAAVLVSPRDKVLRLPGVSPGHVSEAAVRRLIRGVVTSPARRKLLGQVVKPWCTVLFAQSTDATANAHARQAIDQAIAKVPGILREAKETRFQPPALTTVSLTDSREKVLLWSLGLLAGSKRVPKAAVVFGRGRRLGAALKGEGITEEKLSHLLWFLAQNCTCTSDPTWLLGPTTPLVWPRSLEQQVATVLGFDPQSPKAFATLSGVWTTLTGVASAKEKPKADEGMDFIEFDEEPKPNTPSPEATAQANASDQGAAAKPDSKARQTEPPEEKDAATPQATSPDATEDAAAKQKEEPAAGEGAEAEPEVAPSDGTTEVAEPASQTPAEAASSPPAPQTVPADRFQATRAPKQSTQSGRLTRLIAVFGAALALLALGGGAVLVLSRRDRS